jgi:hypothetical protein
MTDAEVTAALSAMHRDQLGAVSLETFIHW